MLGWNTPQQPQQQPPKKAPAASGRLSLFRETVAPQVLLWGGKILLHWCWGETLLVTPWPPGLRSGTARPLCPQHEGKQTGHHCSPAGSPCPFRHEKEQFTTPLFWASTLNKYFSAGYKEIYLPRTILYVWNANKPIHSLPKCAAHISREGSVQMTFWKLFFFFLVKGQSLVLKVWSYVAPTATLKRDFQDLCYRVL